MKRIQKNVFFLPDSAAIIFKIFPSASLQGTCVLRDYIELAGGLCLDDDEDDPFAIPLVDVNFLYEKGIKSFTKSKNDQRNYFNPEFVYDSYLHGKVMDLNKYKIREGSVVTSAQQSYDANQIARRELCWKDVIHQMSSKRAITNKKKESKKNRSKNQLIQSPKVYGTVTHLLPSQCDPPSSGGCGGEDPDGQIMHPSQNHSDDDNNNKEDQFDEMEDHERQNDINIDGDMMIKSIQDKNIAGRSDQINSMPRDNVEDTVDEIRILESDAQVIQDTLEDSQNINIILNHSNNNINEDESVNGSSSENNVVGNELPCSSKSVKRNNNEKESNNKTTPTKSLVDETPLDDDDIDEEKNNKKKNMKRKQTNNSHHSSKKQNKSICTSRSRSSSSTSASSQGKPENKTRPKSKSKQIIKSSDDDDSSNSSDSDSTLEETPKGKEIKTERKGTYTYKESCAILSFINKYKYHRLVGGMLLWRKMEELGKFGRTRESMKEHFRKKLMKNLKYYRCSKENRKKFQKALESRQRRGRITKLYSQDFNTMLDAERVKQENKKKGKSKPQKQETDDDDD